MIPEIGLFFLVAALIFASLLVIVPTLGLVFKKPEWVATADAYVWGLFISVALSYLSLTYCFLTDDFSVRYVLANSSLSLPWFYKLCAVWGGHEGSMMLWVAILCSWTLAVCCLSGSLAREMRCRVLVVLGLLAIGFLLFLLCTSNPFLRQFVDLNSTGRDLNPLLQDPGFLFHPPMLYMGYVGFSVAFAFAVAALWGGEIKASWAKWTRPWTLAAWCCLTIGITLGSWWAYRELGWGGWWFWDPVENASFMPWLTGTALIHSLAVTEKRQQFQAWTLLLAIMAFSLSLIGTFLVRSGVLTSVHAFAVDPQRGLYILGFLMAVIGGSLLLFSFRGHRLRSNISASLLSRESGLLINNLFLVVAMLTVLTGTLYPLIIDGLGLGKLSVGAPYFNAVFVPLMLPMLFFMGLGIAVKWRQDQWKRLTRELNWPAGLSLFLPVMILYLLELPLKMETLAGLMLAFWVILTSVWMLAKQIRQRGVSAVSQAYWGMFVAHLGVAFSVIGIAVSSGYGMEKDLSMGPGDKANISGYQIQFVNEKDVEGPNYKGTEAEFRIRSASGAERSIYPQKRLYEVAKMPMTESAIDVNPFRDIYIALGEPLDQRSWSVRIYYKPMIRWLWAGGFFMLFGGLLAMFDRRYYRMKTAAKLTEVTVEAGQ